MASALDMALEDLCPLVRLVGVAGGVQGRPHGVSAGLLLGPGPRHGPGRGLVVTSVRGSELTPRYTLTHPGVPVRSGVVPAGKTCVLAREASAWVSHW